MKNEDIEVGTRYVNRLVPGYEYLGIGYTNSNSSPDRFKYKSLVIVSSPCEKIVGSVVKNPSESFEGFWDNFIKI